MARTGQDQEKVSNLRLHHALNPTPEAVTDSDFIAGSAFFDARDVVQVKYEMLRRVRHEGRPVTEAAASFGFSRPVYYEAQAVFEAAGLPGLLPKRPGPRRAHKLSESVVDHLEQFRAEDATLRVTQLTRLLEDRLGLKVHPRSVERALARRRKKGLQTSPSRSLRGSS